MSVLTPRLALALLAAMALSACQTVPRTAGFSAEQRRVLESNGFTAQPAGWELSLADRVLFDFDNAGVNSDAHRTLRHVWSELLRVGIDHARIEGNTDSVGNAQYNRRLSLGRARAVAAVMEEAGFRRANLEVIGRGEDNPIADNATEHGRLLNRRVDIIIQPR